MIKEYNFSFNELVIDQQEIQAVLGYGDGALPEPFNRYLEQAFFNAHSLIDIRATYLIVKDVVVDENRNTLVAGKQEFRVGKTICRELKGSERLAFFVCTAGKTISEKSVDLLKGEDPVLGYIYDLLGSAITEAAGDLMQSFLKQEIEMTGHRITNRYSPGYCHWSMEEQHKLFELFGKSPCEVTLTQSFLMSPVKSISGVIGIGHEVKYRDYQCTLCWNKNCVYRKIRRNLKVLNSNYALSNITLPEI